MSDTITGSCNCGSITVTIPKPEGVVLCHCINCRKSSGSLTSGNFSTPTKDVQVKGEPSQYKNPGTSGNEVTRKFCGNCGSPILTVIADPSVVFVKAGLFDPHTVPAPSAHLFARNMEDWEIIHEGASRLEEQ
ncbi:uncharacterized protein I206_101309 [Kwoniella pini CBS 10737]|uniref:CENP-V/GFA domain-containing protein n=1 Tax=Kwoniella pini CBS 10737 TaxID=1296096 RepID=A0A1B9IB08_9TREE|nr:uncharacterized protein I206_00015 [Kwoniella pini CBS 10737]OCF52719.1 hypothetical protein I206_00015 [Kwoniella pini CBS 10737]